HPRLNFEFATFLANLPRHWKEALGGKSDPARGMTAWALGQVVSARAALELLAWRGGSGGWAGLGASGGFGRHPPPEGRRPADAGAAGVGELVLPAAESVTGGEKRGPGRPGGAGESDAGPAPRRRRREEGRPRRGGPAAAVGAAPE